MNNNYDKINSAIVSIAMQGRGGQTAVTASQLLAKFAFESGFKDVFCIPIIGAERRGAPIKAFTKLSKKNQIKTYDSVTNPDYMLIFDTTLLEIPRIREGIPAGTTLIINSDKPVNTDGLPDNLTIYLVDATGICIGHKFMISSGPILNVPMLGAFGKVTGYYDLNTMNKVLTEEFGERRSELNMKVATDAFNQVEEMK